jgi:hypothetical protein
MRTRMELLPEMIRINFDMEAEMRRSFERWFQQAENEPRLHVRQIQARIAAEAMDLANASRADAERLLNEYEAAGGVYDRDRR